MKQKLLRAIMLMVGVVLVFVFQREPGTGFESADYTSSANMRESLGDIQEYLVDQYSSSASSKYKGTATVKTTYSSMGLVVDNISQRTMNNTWNASNVNFPVNGTCGLVAETILFRKYMTLASGRLPEVDTEYGVFSKLAEYAYDCGIFSKSDHNGTSLSEQKKIANYYLDTYQNNKYTANTDTINLWSTLKSYLDSKIRPVKLGLTGTNGNDETVGHAVVATGCYIQKVNYTEKNWLGQWKSKSKEYKIVRICNGWNDSNDPDDNLSWSQATHRFIFFDCVKNMLKLK